MSHGTALAVPNGIPHICHPERARPSEREGTRSEGSAFFAFPDDCRL